jgi:hypothetical protein
MVERMFDLESTAPAVEAWVEQLVSYAGADDDEERVRLIGALERLACAARGLQADLTADLDESVRRAERDRRVSAARQGRGVAAEVALARRESHHRGRQHVGLARVLVDEMPCTRRALRQGRITEWKATILARETACLSVEDRQTVDRRLAGDCTDWSRWASASSRGRRVARPPSWMRQPACSGAGWPSRNAE